MTLAEGHTGRTDAGLPPTVATTPHRYEQLAAYVVGLVETGVLRAGMRAPSLRALAAQNRLSVTTVLQAYRLLEDRGFLEARPKSGFFVTSHAVVAREAPRVSDPPADARPVAVGGSVVAMLQNASDPDLAPFGCAIPSPALLGAGQLDRFLARAARVKGTRYNSYTEPHGHADLRLQISQRAMRWGQALAPDDVVITCGCTEALSLALKAVTRPGDTVAIESPTYFGMFQVLEANGLKALELPTDSRDGIVFDALERALDQRAVAACLLSSSFNNPLGCTMQEDKKRAVAQLLTRHEVPLIEDDIYGDIYFGSARPRPFMALAPEADILYCASFSKTLAPGYRVGWIAAPRRVERVLQHKFSSTLCGPALPQVALADFLASGGYDNHLRRIRRAFAANIDRMTRAITRAFPASTRVSRPDGGFVLWLELSDAVDTGQLYDAALAEGICFAPGLFFTVSDRYRNCLRISCGHEWDARIDTAIARLGALAAASAG